MEETKEKIVIIALLSIIFILFIVREELLSTSYIQEPKYARLQNEISAYRIQNNTLYLYLLKKESYTEIASEAANMGFNKSIIINDQ